jgi:hypothetical protein
MVTRFRVCCADRIRPRALTRRPSGRPRTVCGTEPESAILQLQSRVEGLGRGCYRRGTEYVFLVIVPSQQRQRRVTGKEEKFAIRFAWTYHQFCKYLCKVRIPHICLLRIRS